MDKDKLCWESKFIDLAVKELLKESNTNFDSVIKNLENNKKLYDFIKRIIIDGENIIYVNTDEVENLGTTYGILKEENNNCKVNN